jgi:hypothetical protein
MQRRPDPRRRLVVTNAGHAVLRLGCEPGQRATNALASVASMKWINTALFRTPRRPDGVKAHSSALTRTGLDWTHQYPAIAGRPLKTAPLRLTGGAVLPSASFYGRTHNRALRANPHAVRLLSDQGTVNLAGFAELARTDRGE